MDPLSPLFIIAALVAGFLMFLAPCTLPLVPAYLALISGIRSNEHSVDNQQQRNIIKNALGFVLGFSLIFVLFGAGVGYLGSIVHFRAALTTIGGVFIILLALSMLGWLKLPFSKRGSLPLPPFARSGNPRSAALVGVLFALGWTPCIGPVLGSVLLVATSGASVWYGMLLLFAFALGMALPFLLVAFMYSKSTRFIARYSNALPVIHTAGALFLLLLGVLMLSGDLSHLVTYGTPLFYWLGLEWVYDWL